MSKDAIEKRKQEFLSVIEDPVARDHYRAQLDEAEILESEGVVTSFHELFEVVRQEEAKVEKAAAEERVATETATVVSGRLRRDVAVGILLGALLVILLVLVPLWFLGKL